MARQSRAWELLPIGFVLLVFGWMLFGAWTYVDRYCSNIPFNDDLELAPFLSHNVGIDFHSMWSQANEHRIPLPRLVYLFLLQITGDFRSGMFFQVYAQGALALGMMFFARFLRGRTSYVDAFFPLFWLHWGNAENFLLGMQITIAVPTMLACGVLMLVACKREVPSLMRVLGIGVCLLLLPLNGGFGLCQVPPIALWVAGAGYLRWRGAGTTREKRAAAAMMAAGAVAVALIVFYFVGFQWPERSSQERNLFRAVVIAGQFLTLNLGPVATEYPALATTVTLALTLGALAVCVRAFVRDREERWRASGIFFVMCAPLTIALSIGLGRQDAWPVAGFANRYVTLPSPLFAGVFVAFLLYGWPLLSRFVHVSMYSIFLLLVLYNHQYGEFYGNARAVLAAQFYGDVAAGRSIDELAQRYWRSFYSNEDGFSARLACLYRARMPPYANVPPGDPGPAYDTASNDPAWVRRGDDRFFMLPSRPIASSSPEEIVPRIMERTDVIALRAEGWLSFAIPPAATRLSARFGVLPSVVRGLQKGGAKTAGVRFSVELKSASGAVTQLFEKSLDPVRLEADKHLQPLSLQLPFGLGGSGSSGGAGGEIVLRISSVNAAHPELDWGCWTEVEIR
jgi:hypothetical protein